VYLVSGNDGLGPVCGNDGLCPVCGDDGLGPVYGNDWGIQYMSMMVWVQYVVIIACG
jgi:hypothetical protein